MAGNFTSRRIGIVGTAASWALTKSVAGRCRAWHSVRPFLGSLLRSLCSIRPSAMTCASLAVLVCMSAVVSPAVAQSKGKSAQVLDAVARMETAIKECDYDSWVSAQSDYLRFAYPHAVGDNPPAAPSYPFPCFPVKRAAEPPAKPTKRIQTEFDIKLRERLRTGKRPEREEVEERAEIGRGIGGPRTEAVGFTGFYIGGFVAGNFNTLGQTETLKATDDVTNRFSDSSSAVGGGFNAGFLFSPWNNNILVGPSASVDFLRQDTNHNFPGNVFLGQTTNVIGTVNGQIGVAARPGLFVYGELGLAFANLDHRLNFSGPVTSVNQTVPGLNLGIGAAFQPPDWQIAGNPVAVFAQYNHIYLQDATFNNPGSPGFTYLNQNGIDEFKFGVQIIVDRRRLK
jgi:opacity protein-like surface antigen